ncbi:MAG: hypothetical protein D8M58_17115 [Calditrichaeota bacterium]|nr:MAG: hypothetical protein DWQ03_12245 [Calditrichota bacterium]MBL1207128.1 hypothetical protein [Calditrichota bacterium]NOG46958.1 hypothetical protein [Calditrichota bacterium]
MNHLLLTAFSADVGISIRTLKAKYGDCIHREGRQSFIDREKFEKVFPLRSNKGTKTKATVERSPHIGQVEFHLERLDKYIEKCMKVIEAAKKAFEAATEPKAKERRLLIYLDEKQNLKAMEIKREKLNSRKIQLIERKKEELSSFDEDGLLASL